jgi:hypothetical protein
VGGLLALGTVTLLGAVAGRCTGYVAGFVGGAITGNLPAWKDAGIHFGIPIGSVTLPLLLLVAWMLLRWGHRHYKAALATKAEWHLAQPPAAVRHGLSGLFRVLVFSMVMVPTALGVWLGSMTAWTLGIDSGLESTALSGLGLVLGLGIPYVVWHRAQGKTR